MHGATKVTLQHHQILHLPRKITLMIDRRHIWNIIYNARSNTGYPPTSPNIAPATKNDSHDWSSSHMKRYLQCAEQHRLPSNITKYCTCHEKWLSWLILVTYETLFTMRGATQVTLQHHQILHLPRKMTLMIDPRHIWNVIYNARSNTGYPPTSPNIAPATKNDSHDWSSSHMKRYLQCAEQHRLPSNITKYCTCHEKWLSWLIVVSYETLFTMCRATEATIQHHQVLCLPRKMSLQNFKELSRKQLKRHLQCGADPTMIRTWSRQSATRLATEVTCRTRHEHVLLKNPTFHAPAIIPNFTKCCHRHEKWHLNFSEYCTFHEKWHLHSTKYCTGHDKWHLYFTSLLFSTTLLYSSLLFSTLLDSSLLVSTLLDSSLLYSMLLYSSLLFANLLYYSRLFSTLLYSTLLYYSLIFFTIRDSPLLFSTLLYSTLLSLTLLLFSDSSILDSAIFLI